MTHFNAIQLILEDGFSEEERLAVTTGSRSMINYVERYLAVGRYPSEFTKLNIYCSKDPVVDKLIRYKEPARYIGIRLQQDPGAFLAPPDRFHHACADMVRAGVRAAIRHIALPAHEIFQAIDDFTAGGFVNQWVHADRYWTRSGVRIVIRCELQRDAFVLYQSISQDGVDQRHVVIARTKPREGLFVPLLGRLSLRAPFVIFHKGERVISEYNLVTQTISIRPGTI